MSNVDASVGDDHLGKVNRVHELFVLFRDQSIPVCIWKSADRWNDGVKGKTDFDVLIDVKNIDKAERVLIQQRWIRLNAEDWRSFPDVRDYVTLIDGRWLHFHLHGQIVTGEKLIKSLRPLLTSLYLRYTDINSFPPFVRAELEFILFIVRTTLKLTFIDWAGAVRRRSWRTLYRRYRGEYDDLKARCSREVVCRILQEPDLQRLPKDIILLAFDDLDSLNRSRRTIIRNAVACWRTPGPLARWVEMLRRSYLMRVRGVGKHLPSRGLSIAVVGPDGSGKTTLANLLQQNLSRHIATQHFYLGGNNNQPGRIRALYLRLFWYPYLVVRKIFKVLSMTSVVRSVENLFYGWNLRLMKYEKVRNLIYAEKCLSKGGLVIFERYPLFVKYGDDMLDSVIDYKSESYQAPDILVFIDAEVETVLQRRAGEDSSVISEKARVFRAYFNDWSLPGSELVTVKAESPVDKNLSDVLKCISNRLADLSLHYYDSDQQRYGH